MATTPPTVRRILLVLSTALFLSLAGCSSDSSTSSNSSANALPQPSVDCGGSSCID